MVDILFMMHKKKKKTKNFNRNKIYFEFLDKSILIPETLDKFNHKSSRIVTKHVWPPEELLPLRIFPLYFSLNPSTMKL